MNTTTEKLTQNQVNKLQQLNQAIDQANLELAQVLTQKIDYHLGEIRKAEAELGTLDPRLFAENMHLFTLIFKRGEMALVIVHGAPTQYQARNTLSHLFKHYEYSVLDGNQTNGRVVGDVRCWYSSVAQEIQSRQAEDGR